jgi:EmrB/QacA subfamily drug resistance transporter
METLDTTIINTAIPTIARSLNVDPINLKVALISYLLSLAIFIPISGWLADKYGAKRVYITALIIFTISSFWCGLSQTLEELVLARILQGIGGAFMSPVGRLIVMRTCDKHELVKIMSNIMMIAALGLMLGPVLGGLISHYFSWRWIFWINIPVGIFNILFTLYLLPSIQSVPVPRLDKFGFILFGLGLSGLTFSLSILSESNISITEILFIISASIFLLISYVLHSRHQAHPIVKTTLFNARTFRTSVLGNLFARLGFGGVPFLLPLLLQIGLHYSAQLAGLLIAPIAIGIIIAKLFTIHLLKSLGYKRLLIFNTLFIALSIALFSTIDNETTPFQIALLSLLFGSLISLQYSAMNSLAYADINHDELSSATSFMAALQQIAQSLGVAISAIGIKIFMLLSITQELSPAIFHYVFLAMAILTLLSCIIFIFLKRHDGYQLITDPAKN